MLEFKEYQLIELLLKTEKSITNKTIGNFISTEKIEFRDAKLAFNGNFLIITQTSLNSSNLWTTYTKVFSLDDILEFRTTIQSYDIKKN